MSDHTGLVGDLLRGAADIAQEMFGSRDRSAQRKVYHLRAQLPVFQLEEDGLLYAFRSRLRSFLEAQSAVKEQHIAAVATAKPLAVKSLPSKSKPRRRRARKAAA